MQNPAQPQATAHACLRAALRADAAAACLRGNGLVVLILTLLLRLLARTEAAWPLPEDDATPSTPHFDPHPIYQPPIGRAPHAACIEAGLVPDWILPGIRNRGMRPAAPPTPPPHPTRPARAPPATGQITLQSAPSKHANFVSITKLSSASPAIAAFHPT